MRWTQVYLVSYQVHVDWLFSAAGLHQEFVGQDAIFRAIPVVPLSDPTGLPVLIECLLQTCQDTHIILSTLFKRLYINHVNLSSQSSLDYLSLSPLSPQRQWSVFGAHCFLSPSPHCLWPICRAISNHNIKDSSLHPLWNSLYWSLYAHTYTKWTHT